MKKKLSLAIIGCGNIANYHIRVFNRLGLKISSLNKNNLKNKLTKLVDDYNF